MRVEGCPVGEGAEGVEGGEGEAVVGRVGEGEVLEEEGSQAGHDNACSNILVFLVRKVVKNGSKMSKNKSKMGKK